MKGGNKIPSKFNKLEISGLARSSKLILPHNKALKSNLFLY